MTDKSFEAISARMREYTFQDSFDCIVAIANGGIIPAAMLNQALQLEMHLLKINFRDALQRPQREKPTLIEPIHFPVLHKTILLVEDRVKTGQTLNLAKQLLLAAGAAEVKTFAVNGKADYALFDEACFKFPWII